MVCDRENVYFFADYHVDYSHMYVLCSMVVCVDNWQISCGISVLCMQYRIAGPGLISNLNCLI